ncbi:hypothetical protein SAMN04487894_101115 [Niabella drilacis]|uniref:Uncharacterized protein n=1 Tax=Niabella drilacis (strain DSM 25811 / CCM 8410 / CCUG 62505 / LMG 26954 / E90) TaxID=1285928 RepID=A0A1G6I6U5_NIADE|nr:hypothetical protein SAMN04487894_101115 [Niabella drilacis]
MITQKIPILGYFLKVISSVNFVSSKHRQGASVLGAGKRGALFGRLLKWLAVTENLPYIYFVNTIPKPGYPKDTVGFIPVVMLLCGI